MIFQCSELIYLHPRLENATEQSPANYFVYPSTDVGSEAGSPPALGLVDSRGKR